MSHIYSIGSGKGGSGKSFINANLGALFAKQGKSVVLVIFIPFLGSEIQKPGSMHF